MQRWQRYVMRRAATRYAQRGWPVVPGAALVGDRYVCGPVCPTVGCHPATDRWEQRASDDVSQIDRWWADRAHSVLLVTGHAFDVIEMPARLGILALAYAPRGPVCATPTGRWMFLVSPGDTLRPELASRLDVVLHGRGSWIPAPPTRTPGSNIHWHVTPEETRWHVPDSYAVQRAVVGHAPTVGEHAVTGRHPEDVRPGAGGDPWHQGWSGGQRWAGRIRRPHRQRWSTRNVDTPVARSMS